MRGHLLLLLLLGWLFVPFESMAQKNLPGRILSSAGQAVSGCSIFLSNTSVGTVSDENGKFLLSGIPSGRYDLIVSHVGYETYSQTIDGSKLPNELTIILEPKVAELENVTVGNYERGDWKEWGETFLKSFIGDAELQRGVKLKNPKALEFRYFRKRNELIAIADEPLEIENKTLGYRIRYQMEGYSFNFSKSRIFYMGYPFFEEMEGSKGNLARRERNREAAYTGSFMHFLRSLFRNQLLENQFDVHRYRIVSDTSWRTDPNDTLNPQKKYSVRKYALLDKAILTGDSIAYASDSVTVWLDFPYQLQVAYNGAVNKDPYRDVTGAKEKYPKSYLILDKGLPVQIFHYGSFYPPENLTVSGFWGWSEKMARMLPFDYQPPPKPVVSKP